MRRCERRAAQAVMVLTSSIQPLYRDVHVRESLWRPESQSQWPKQNLRELDDYTHGKDIHMERKRDDRSEGEVLRASLGCTQYALPCTRVTVGNVCFILLVVRHSSVSEHSQGLSVMCNPDMPGDAMYVSIIMLLPQCISGTVSRAIISPSASIGAAHSKQYDGWTHTSTAHTCQSIPCPCADFTSEQSVYLSICH